MFQQPLLTTSWVAASLRYGSCKGLYKKGDTIIHVDESGKENRRQVTKIEGYQGIIKVEMDEAGAGDIVSISGVPEVIIGDTLCSPEKIVKLAEDQA